MATAQFDINADGQDLGFKATAEQVLTLKVRTPAGANSIVFQVWDPTGVDPSRPISANPPRASKGAPLLSLVGATTGTKVSPTTPSGTVTLTMPPGAHSYIIRCIRDGGQRLVGGKVVADPSLVYERGVWTPTPFDTRKVVATEVQQFEAEGWAGALVDHIAAGGVGLPDNLSELIDDENIIWTGSNTFSGDLVATGAVVFGTAQLEPVAATPKAVTLGSTVTRLYLFDGDATITSITGANAGRVLFVHVVSGVKRFEGGFFCPGNVPFFAGPRSSFWLLGDGAAWIVCETEPRYRPPSPNALLRTMQSRLNDEVFVTDFMTPAQIADANNGTRLFDMAPAIQAAIDWILLYSLGGSATARGRLRLPAGVLRIDRTLHINYGTVYRSLVFEGEGQLRGADHGMPGTALFANFSDGPAIAVTMCLDTVIKQMSITGINDVRALIENDPATATMSELDPSAWVQPGLAATANTRYTQYAAISIDPYSGPQPTPHYPDVPLLVELGVAQYGKGPSTNITIEDVYINNFVVGVALQTANYDGSGDFVRLCRVSIWFCAYGLSWGNSQARSMSITDSHFAYLHTAITSTTHGYRIGYPGIAVFATSFMTSIQLFEIMNLGYGVGPYFAGCFAEAVYRLGKVNGQSRDACGLAFQNCEFGLSWWARYGVPSWVLEMEGAVQAVFNTCKFYNTDTRRGYLGFRASGSGIVGEPARSLQFINCESIAPELTIGRTLPERCAVNGTLGVVITLGSTCVDRFSVHSGFISDLDANTMLGYGVLHTEQTVAPRKHCAPVYAKKLKSLINGNDVGVEVAWRTQALTISTIISISGRVVTFTSAGVDTASLAHTGGDVGDVLMTAGPGAVALVVKSRTGTTFVAEAMTGFDRDDALLAPIVAAENALYTINCRRHALEAVLYGDITLGSAIVTDLVLGNGEQPDLESILHVDDYLYVDQDVDQCLNPVDGSARLASFNTDARTMTFAGNFKYSQTRRRFTIFVRPGLPNA